MSVPFYQQLTNRSFGSQNNGDQAVMGTDHMPINFDNWSQSWPNTQDNIYGFLGLGSSDHDSSRS